MTATVVPWPHGSSDRRVALLTGGSRGIGADTCLELTGRGYAVAFTYRNKTARAEGVAARIRARGGDGLALMVDITRADQVTHLAGAIARWSGRLDLLVLSASGGLERELVAANPDYPMLINRDAQLLVLDAALPLLAEGSTVIYVTSHWAHLYGRVEQLPPYEPVARTKHAGELALRQRQAELAERAIRLIVVTGDLVEGTISAKLLERAAPGVSRLRRAAPAALPSTLDMARAIAHAAVDRSLPTGHTVVVGRALASLADAGDGGAQARA